MHRFRKALHHNIEYNEVAQVKDLLDSGDHNVNEKDGVQEMTPIMIACQFDLDLDLHAAGLSLDRDIMVEMLLRHHADVSLVNTHGKTAVYLAVEHNRPETLKVVCLCFL